MCKSFSVEVIHAHYSWTSKYCRTKNCVDRNKIIIQRFHSHDKNHFHNFFAICSNCLHTISATKYQTSIEIKNFYANYLVKSHSKISQYINTFEITKKGNFFVHLHHLKFSSYLLTCRPNLRQCLDSRQKTYYIRQISTHHSICIKSKK